LNVHLENIGIEISMDLNIATKWAQVHVVIEPMMRWLIHVIMGSLVQEVTIIFIWKNLIIIDSKH